MDEVNIDDQLGATSEPAPRPAPDKRITLTLFTGLVVLLGISGGWPLLVVVFAIVVMITLHEFGHFLTAKWSGMKVTEFFLGFGPKLWSFQRGETEYGVKAIPAGAYVRIIGMHNLEEIPPEDEARTYRQQSYPKRLLVVSAGSGMHFILCMICLFMMMAVTGAPGGHVFSQNIDDWQILEVTPHSAADLAGLQPGDRVTSIDGDTITEFSQMPAIIQARPDKTVPIEFVRDGTTHRVFASIANVDGRGKLGIASGLPPSHTVGVATAAGRTVTEFGTGVHESIKAIGALFSPSGIADFVDQVRHGGSPTVDDKGTANAPASSSEPTANENRPVSIIGAANIGSQLTRDGLYGFLAFFATINLFIGIVNLAPLLPLDGGHVAIATYERIRSRKGRRYHVDVVKLLPLTYAVVMLLVLLFASTVFLDLVDPIRLN